MSFSCVPYFYVMVIISVSSDAPDLVLQQGADGIGQQVNGLYSGKVPAVDQLCGRNVLIHAGKNADDRYALSPGLADLVGSIRDPGVSLIGDQLPLPFSANFTDVVGLDVGQNNEDSVLIPLLRDQITGGTDGKTVPVVGGRMELNNFLVFSKNLLLFPQRTLFSRCFL